MSAITVLKTAFAVVIQFLVNVYKGGLHNTYNVFTLPLNFFINFLPISTWLFIFKHAGSIPISWRPDIHGKISFFGDMFMFGDYWGEIFEQVWSDSETLELLHTLSFVTSALCFAVPLLAILPLCAWYYVYYVRRSTRNVVMYHMPFTTPVSQLPYFMFPLMVWCLLNVAHVFAEQDDETFTDGKNMLAWIFYVVVHLLEPIFVAIYLYVFKAPGTLKCFSLAMGLQNISGVLTHLLVPMTPPWFIHFYGLYDMSELDYDTPGYAAGLTRVNFSAGTHLATAGFHKSPIVFGAVPSLHSAMAFQSFLFVWTQTCQGSLSYWRKGSSDCVSFAAKDRESGQHDSALHQGMDSTATLLPHHSEYELDAMLEDDAEGSLGEYIERGSFRLTSSDQPSNCSIDTVASMDDEGHNYNNNNNNSGHSQHQEDSTLRRVVHSGYPARAIVVFLLSVQLWATMYLDHHFRFDLFIGYLYSVVSFMIVNHFILQKKIIHTYLQKRSDAVDPLKTDPHDQEDRSMGMRVLKDTRAEWFFDSLTL